MNLRVGSRHQVIKVSRDNKIVGCFSKKDFRPRDFMAVQVTALRMVERPTDIVLLLRASHQEQAGQPLFQSGKINATDLGGQIKVGQKMFADVVVNAMVRELQEELGLSNPKINEVLGRTGSKLLSHFDMQRPDKNYWFRFYLAVMMFTRSEIASFKFDHSIVGTRQVEINSDPLTINPQADQVFIHMFNVLQGRESIKKVDLRPLLRSRCFVNFED